MITGFNTDIEHDGVIYHVQTEDKGVETPLILSLVYDRGTILASKRSPYNDLVQSGFDEQILAERLQKQHKLICAAVRAGRIEELKRMTAKDSALKKDARSKNTAQNPAPAENHHAAHIVQSSQYSSTGTKFVVPPVNQPANSPAHMVVKETFAPPIPQPTEELVWDLPLEIVEEAMIFEIGNVIEAETILSLDAVEIISDLDNLPKSKTASLEIEFLNETVFKAGERKTLNIRVFRGNSENFISGVQVMVKVLGSAFRPLIFHAKTDSNGIAIVHLQLPQFRSGRGAILVRAISDGEEAELRQIIRPS